MAQLQVLRRRIRSISNTRQTTKAMQLVDATKLRRAQAAARRSHDYIEATLATLQRLLSTEIDQSELRLWRRTKIQTVAIIAIASDRGLAGAYNHNIAARLGQQVAKYQAAGIAVKVVAIGAQTVRMAKHLHDVTVLESITGRATDPGIADVRPLAEKLREEYAAGNIDAIEVIYTHSQSALKQEVRVSSIWPVKLDENEPASRETSPAAELAFGSDSPRSKDARIDASHSHVQTLLEPSPEEVVSAVLARLFDAAVLNAAQEAGVSEHAMRMLAMRNATDNASDLIDTLTLQVNTIRQADITQEIAEITGAAAAIEEQ
ncbi:MAG TPA: ATP synthase F1 subunit gamma [Candidatus Saccharimonadales bacterium]|nr:ATP synthase F1 subunit gamma [Candidatus Saccharimonadales bacterium]